MKTPKKLAVLVSCACLSVLLAGASACSLITAALDGDLFSSSSSSSGSGSGSGSDSGSTSVSVVGTHTMTMSLYDENWFTESTGIDSKVIAELIEGMGVVNEQTNTLVLNADGTYQLTKRLDIDYNDAWTFLDGYYEYTYYGSYTANGSTVTLGQVESITYSVENFAVDIIIDFGSITGEEYENVEEKVADFSVTEQTTDLDSPSGFVLESYTWTVIDLWYGPYLDNTGKGNVSQMVTIGTYDWGGFTFGGSTSVSVVGTHTMTMSLYNDNWFSENTGIDSNVITELLDGMGVVNEQTNTLVLNADGTYQLTKRLDIDYNDAWTFLDGYYEYTYYGNYTADGSTVTLGEVESITYTVENFAVDIIIDFGSITGEKYENIDVEDFSVTEQTTELDSPSGFVLESNTWTVIDLWYGPYLNNTGMGNVSQTVILDSYAWGDFTFARDK